MPLAMRFCLSRLRRASGVAGPPVPYSSVSTTQLTTQTDSTGAHRSGSAHPRADRAEPVELGPVVLTRADVDRRVQRTGHDELPGAQVSAQRVQGLDQP